MLEREAGQLAARGLPSQEAVQGDVTDPASLRRAVEGQEVVVHLVAIITGRPEEFERVMEQGTRDLVAAAKEAGVQRFVLMSALGTSEETKDLVPYYRAKWAMEQAVKGSGLEHVIFRPSFVFGRDGGALQQFRRIAKLSPVTPIVGPGTQRIQPIWVEDVAAYFAAAVVKPEAANRTFELGGPDVVTWNEFWSRLKQAHGRAAPDDPRALRADAGPGGGAREAAEAAGHPRPADDARGRRQRRHQLGRGRHLRPPARPARRAAPPRDRQDVTVRQSEEQATLGAPTLTERACLEQTRGRFRGPSILGTSLYWQRRFLPKRRDVGVRRTPSAKPPTLARRFPLQVLGARPYRLAPPLPVLEISTAGPPPFRG